MQCTCISAEMHQFPHMLVVCMCLQLLLLWTSTPLPCGNTHLLRVGLLASPFAGLCFARLFLLIGHGCCHSTL